MKKRVIIVLILAAVLLMTGCGLAPSLPDAPAEFHTGTFVNPTDTDDTYQSIAYNGRMYIPFGTIGKTMHRSDIAACLGYIVQDGIKMEDERICLLQADPNADFLVCVPTGGFMEQPFFYRAVDTAGKKIRIPPYIDVLGYDFWN